MGYLIQQIPKWSFEISKENNSSFGNGLLEGCLASSDALWSLEGPWLGRRNTQQGQRESIPPNATVTTNLPGLVSAE